MYDKGDAGVVGVIDVVPVVRLVIAVMDGEEFVDGIGIVDKGKLLVECDILLLTEVVTPVLRGVVTDTWVD